MVDSIATIRLLQRKRKVELSLVRCSAPTTVNAMVIDSIDRTTTNKRWSCRSSPSPAEVVVCLTLPHVTVYLQRTVQASLAAWYHGRTSARPQCCCDSPVGIMLIVVR
jgi:hypothetical protein